MSKIVSVLMAINFTVQGYAAYLERQQSERFEVSIEQTLRTEKQHVFDILFDGLKKAEILNIIVASIESNNSELCAKYISFLSIEDLAVIYDRLFSQEKIQEKKSIVKTQRDLKNIIISAIVSHKEDLVGNTYGLICSDKLLFSTLHGLYRDSPEYGTFVHNVLRSIAFNFFAFGSIDKASFTTLMKLCSDTQASPKLVTALLFALRVRYNYESKSIKQTNDVGKNIIYLLRHSARDFAKALVQRDREIFINSSIYDLLAAEYIAKIFDDTSEGIKNAINIDDKKQRQKRLKYFLRVAKELVRRNDLFSLMPLYIAIDSQDFTEEISKLNHKSSEYETLLKLQRLMMAIGNYKAYHDHVDSLPDKACIIPLLIINKRNFDAISGTQINGIGNSSNLKLLNGIVSNLLRMQKSCKHARRISRK